jgi:hypothetical protein
MKFLKQNNINPKRTTDQAVSSSVNGTVKLKPTTNRLVEIDTNTGLIIPIGTTSSRPAPVDGVIRFNSTTKEFEGYNGTGWGSLGGVKDLDGDTFILAESTPGANENTFFFSTGGIVSTTIAPDGVISKNLTTNGIDINSLSPDNETLTGFKTTIVSTEGQTANYSLKLPKQLGKFGEVLGLGEGNQLEFLSPDNGGNRIYVSNKIGNDDNDGVTAPVQTIRRALQLASKLVYKQSFEYNEDVCYRDVGLIVEGLSFDLAYNSNWRSIKAGVSYYNATASEVLTSQKSVTLAALEYLKELAVSTQISGTSESTLLASLMDIIIDIFDEGESAAPTVTMPSPIGAPVGFSNAKDLILQNIDFIADEIITWINYQKTNNIAPFTSSFTFNETSCRRDTRLIAYSIAYDLIYGGNSQTVDAAVKYFQYGSGPSVIPGESAQTIAATERAKFVVRQIILSNTDWTKYTTLTQTTGTAGSTVAANEADDLYNIIIGVLTDGPTVAPAVVDPIANKNADYEDGIGFLVAAKDRIATYVVSNSSNYVPNGVKITIQVATGEYNEQNPLIIPDNVSIVGDGLRSCIVRPINANRDMFKVRNGCYFTEFTFRDKLDDQGIPTNTWDYAFSFDDPLNFNINRIGYTLPISKPLITTSPYIQNCSIVSFLGGNGVLIDGNKVITPNTPPEPELVEIPVDLSDGLPEQGKSMVANAFTMLSFGGTGWRIINDAYAQLVSCFQIFMLNGTYCQSGGYVSITNSATNFGKYALRASGYSPNSFLFDRGYIAGTGLVDGAQTLKVVGYGRVPVNHFVLRFRNDQGIDVTEDFKPALTEKTFDAASDINLLANIITIANHGYVESQEVLYVTKGNDPIGGLDENQIYYVSVISPDTFKLYFDEDRTFEVNLLSIGSGNQSFLSNIEEFFIDEIIESHNFYQKLTLAPGSYTFIPGSIISSVVGVTINNGYVYSYNNDTRELIVSINKVTVGVTEERVLFTTSSPILNDHDEATNIVIESATRINNLFSAEFSVKSTVTNNKLENINTLINFQLYLHRPSIVNSSAHTWEYSGSGIDYNALPQNGGKTDVATEQFSQLPGRVYTSGTNELGDFKVGDFILAENKTGNISFKNKVIVSELTALKLSLSDVEIETLSTDVGLGDNEPGGPQNTRLSTQLAIRSFLKNRLGNFIDKNLSTNSVPGSVVQLNSLGQINSDLIPATRNFAVNSPKGFLSRLTLSEQVPPSDVLNGDIASEEYEIQTLTLEFPVTLDKGDLVFQENSDAVGIVSLDANNTVTLEVASVGQNFTIPFVNNENLIITDSTRINVQAATLPVETSVNYFLANDSASQFLVLDGNYDFTLGNTVTSVVNQAQGTITEYREGVITALNNSSIISGDNYTPDNGNATYLNVALTGGSGVGARADITVSNGAVTIVTLRSGGSGYQIGDLLSAESADLNSTPLSPFGILVSLVETRLYVDLIGNVKFTATASSPDFITDNTDTSTELDLDSTYVKTFLAPPDENNIDYVNSRILGEHEFSNGDPVIYSPGANLAIGGLVNQQIYYVKVISSTVIELYNEYSLISKIIFTSDSGGQHSLTRRPIMIDVNTVVLINHGLSTGDAISISGNDLPEPLISNTFFYVGSITVNSFTLHTNRGEALTSVAGVSVNPVELTSLGGGAATIFEQNVSIVRVVNTSSKNIENWKLVAFSTIDASSIISGVVATSRLAGDGIANSSTYLRGDSTWSGAVATLRKTTETSPITINGDGDDSGFFGNVSIDINRVDGVSGTSLYTNLGAARFLKEQFDVGTNSAQGNVAIRNGVIDAGSLNGLDSSYFLNSENHSTQSVLKGGTGLTSYAIGDMLFANSTVSFGKIAIGTKNRVLTVREPVPGTLAPGWSDEIEVNAVTVNFARTSTATLSLATTTPTTLDSFNKTAFRSASYQIQITNLTTQSYSLTNIMLVHNGETVVRLTEYGTVSTDDISKGSFSANIVDDNVRLIFTSINNNSLQIKVVRTRITP